MSPREPRCHQDGMDARRRDAAKAGRLGKERNDADARLGDNPSGAGWARRSALLPRPGVYQHTASSAPSPAPRAPRSRSRGLMR
jgi:hypothetical protein